MQTLNEMMTGLLGKVGSLLPGIAGALLVLFVGIIIARILKRVVLSLLRKTTLDDKIGQRLKTDFRIDNFVANLVYYLVLLFVLLTVLSMMNVDNVLEPLQNMLNKFLGFIPDLIASGIIGFIGYVVAKIASEGVGFVSGRLESYSDKMGITDTINLTSLLKQIVFIPILIVALDTLNMKAISEPATEMLSTFMNAIPKIIVAVLILGVFYFFGKYVTSMLSELLKNLGVDDFSQKLGVAQVVGQSSLSTLVGQIAFFFLMFGGIITAVDKLELGALSGILDNVFEISGKIFFGLIILALGNYISQIAADAIGKTEDNAWLSSLVRFVTIGIFLAIGLSTMGIGQDIVNMAFGLTLGAAAVAFALSFGLGGREAAGKTMDEWLSNFRKK